MNNPDNLIYDLSSIGLCYKGFLRLPWQKQHVFWALEDVSFQVFRGETVGIIGRNGAGKSTLLRILAGIVEPDRGNIYRAELRSTLLSLGAGFDMRLSGRQNIYLNGLLLGMGKSEIDTKIDGIIELSELESFIDQPVMTYSTGMRARLGFSIAYAIDPDVILIDETLGVGDARFQQKSSTLIKEKIRSNHTVVLVSHSLGLVRELCDRIIWIENGIVMPDRPKLEQLDAYNLHLKDLNRQAQLSGTA